jgi:hypothetical protein
LSSPRFRSSFSTAYSTGGLDADSIIDRILKALLTAKVFLGCLHRSMTQQKLNLVQLPSGIAAQPSAGPPKVVRG